MNKNIHKDKKNSSPEDFKKYLEGKLSSLESHDFEKRLLEDDFEAQAFEGLSSLSKEELNEDLSGLKQNLKIRVERKDIYKYLKIAAGILLIGVFSFLVYSIIQNNPVENISSNTKNIFKADSVREAQQKEEEARKYDSTDGYDERLLAYEKEPGDVDDLNETDAPMPLLIPPASPLELSSDPEQADELIVEENVLRDTKEEMVNTESEPIIMESSDMEIIDMDMQEVQAPVPSEKAKRYEEEGYIAGDLGNAPAAKRAFSNTANVRTITGNVTASDGKGMSGVKVNVKGTGQSTLTNRNGVYSLDVPDDDNVVLVFSSTGFLKNEVKLGNKQEVDLRLQEDLAALSDIVIVGFAESKEESENSADYTSPEPIGGFSAYRSYINRNLQYPSSAIAQGTKGTVKLIFKVMPDGRISGLAVDKGMGGAFDQEAIRVVREGPSWKPATSGGSNVEEEVTLRIKFRPPN